MVVVFRIHPRQNYALQAKLQKISATQIYLQYEDPRRDVRFSVTQADPVAIQVLSAETVRELYMENLEIVRQTTWALEDRDVRKIIRLEDGLRRKGDEEPCEIAPYVERTWTTAGGLRDISLGGAGVLLDGVFLWEQGEGKVLLIGVRLPRQVDKTVTAEDGLSLKMLATARGGQSTTSQTHLHVQFVHRLPDCLDLSQILQEDVRP